MLDIAARHHAFVVEDDWARDFALEGDPPPPLAAADRSGHVVYLRSLTKCAAPSLRIGALCARGPALDRLRAARLVDDFFVPGPLQEIALQLVTAPAWPRHLRALRSALKRNRDLLGAALRSHLGDAAPYAQPAGGLHLWLRLPEGRLDTDAAAMAGADEVIVIAGRYSFPAEPPANYLRLSFATVEPDWVDAAAAIVAKAVLAMPR